jgi:4'-phosphopantetheinyl transferase
MDEAVLHPSFREAQPGTVDLPPKELHVWAVPLTGDPDRFGTTLSAAEKQRLARLRFADHQRRFHISHGALRAILAGYVGLPASTIEFSLGPRGKPYLVHHHGQPKVPFFNLSHSGKLGLIGIAHHEVGVDLEKMRHLESLREIAQRHFSSREYEELSRLDGEAQKLAFYRCWTRKEAYIKALGEGLSMPLDTFDVSLCEEPRFLCCHDGREDPANWSLLDVSPGAGFAAAATLRATGVEVRRFCLPGTADAARA